MKSVVLMKAVPDTASVLQLDVDNRSILTEGLEFILNPYDEFALEEAIRLKESSGGEVIAVGVGDEHTVKCLRQALAVGADFAILIRASEPERITPSLAAKLLAVVIRDLQPDAIFAGKQAIDDDAAQVPERVAELLGLPHVSAITRLTLDSRSVMVERQVEGDHYTISTALPALFTTEKGLNQPRYPRLPEILKAKRKEIREIDPEDLTPGECELLPGQVVTMLTLQEQKRSAIIMSGSPDSQVTKLVSILKADGLL